jgi:RHS repeat-associated protein
LLADPTAQRFNFQTVGSDTPDGWLADSGVVQSMSPERGWSIARTPVDRDHLGRPLYDTFIQVDAATWKLPVANGTHAVAIMCGDADSRAQTNHLMVNGISLPDPTPYDGLVTLGYETGSFDGYALTVTVTDGFVTVQAGAGALDPKINFIEIAPVGTVIDAPTSLRVQAAAVQATQDTAKPKAKTPPVVKRYVWGVYVDELVSNTVAKPRKSPVRYYVHSNSLYSIAATTSTAGSVVERYSYNAYGTRTAKNSAGVTLAKSAVGQDQGFTGYKLDAETGMYFARARMYSSKLGRFVSRDEWQYIDGYSLYSAYFSPNQLDPYGTWASSDGKTIDCTLSDSGWIDAPQFSISGIRLLNTESDIGLTLGGFRLGYLIFGVDINLPFSWYCSVSCNDCPKKNYIWDHDENHVGGVQVTNLKVRIPVTAPYPMPGPASLRLLRTLAFSAYYLDQAAGTAQPIASIFQAVAVGYGHRALCELGQSELIRRITALAAQYN